MSEDHLEPILFKAPTLEELDVLMDGYQFESFIAQGGMGAVYLARQTSLDRQVAIKVLPRELGDDVKFRESFEAEAKHMARLNHPNLIGIYDFGDVDGMLYIIMEYVKGKSLFDSAHGNAIIQETAAKIIRDICLGLDDAHDAGILHRDIKPSNILIGKKATPKIGDFGLARPTGTAETGVIYGTPGYSAPEVLNAPNEVDVRTDVFAVGVMFYELLTGSMPQEVYVSMNELAEVDERFDRVVMKAIAPRPSDRYDSAGDLAKDITDLLKEINEESKKPENPLLRGASKSSGISKLAAPVVTVPAPVKVLVGSPKVDALSKKQTVRSSNVSSGSVAAPPSAGNGARNMVIILILLGAVYGALQYKGWKENDVAKKNETINAEADSQQKVKDDLAAKLAKERQKDAEARRKEKELREQKKIDNAPRVTDIAEPEMGPGHADYPMVQLKNSKVELFSGTRDKNIFPESVIFRDNNSRAVMFINEAMTWDEADKWANEYGAHLAICTSKSDVSQFSKMITDDEAAWLGGGNNGNKGWTWVDGSEWRDFGSLPTTKKRAFVTVSNFANINSEGKYDQKLPFFIEWKMQKTEEGEINPGSIENRLERISKEVGGLAINPQFPAGSMSLGSRTYCPVYREMTYLRAEQLAVRSGGHLLVVSNIHELIYLQEFISRFLKPGVECWIGGSKSDDLWGWNTGEDWVKIPWLAGHPEMGTKLQVVTGDKLMLKDAKSSDIAPMFIIEWSNDKDSVAKTIDSGSGGDGVRGLKKINNWHAAKLQKEIIAVEKLLIANGRKLTFDLEVYLKSLPKNERAEQEVAVNKIHESVKNSDRISAVLKSTGPTEKVQSITEYGVEKQELIEEGLNKKIEKLCKLYLQHLAKYKVEMVESGQESIIKAIAKEVESVGRDADDYRKHFNQ